MVKKYFKRRTFRKRAQPKAYLQSYAPKRAQRPELKFYSSTLPAIGFGSVSTSGTAVKISDLIGRGTDRFNRIGSKIAITSIWMKVKYTGSDDTNAVRMLLFRDWKEGTTVYPTVNGFADIDKMTVYKDVFQTTNNQITGVGVQSYRTVGIKFKRPLVISYSSGTDTAVDPLMLYFVSDSSLINHPSVDGPLIINYYDV